MHATFGSPFGERYNVNFLDGIAVLSNLKGEKIPMYRYPDRQKFIRDLTMLEEMIANPRLKCVCRCLLSNLSSMFEIHVNRDGPQGAEQQKVNRIDFNGVHKVDPHIHVTAALPEQCLLRFIQETWKRDAKKTVLVGKGGPMSLEQVFGSLGIKKELLNVDMLNVHADKNTFGNFPHFNTLYNPFGQPLIREIYLKYDNHVQGTYLAEMVKAEMKCMQECGNQHVEYRVTVGKAEDNWHKLARLAMENELYSQELRWIAQIPRN